MVMVIKKKIFVICDVINSQNHLNNLKKKN